MSVFLYVREDSGQTCQVGATKCLVINYENNLGKYTIFHHIGFTVTVFNIQFLSNCIHSKDLLVV